ncbi:hypothetical protein DFR58_10563 [Anaerobacterium chartisolvens]|uniref:DUF948 domain-containing protein n=1 Tax=Anaerobacterium chartisolvens TaxID=1297424 RepID=A0A369BF38_9FIRM|nr:hypothetical protein [Anaerobacterium chartisolvens]RCX18304.1 hypothetical protein DFR58_10563 [Anaerobacterium chartisolvens]
MDMIIRLGDLVLITALFALVVISVYLIVLIRNINGSIKVLKKLLKENRECIDSTLKDIPVISKNVAEISTTAKDELKSVETAIHGLGEAGEMIAAAAQTVRKDILGRIKGVVDLLDIITRVFFSDSSGNGSQTEEKDKD